MIIEGEVIGINERKGFIAINTDMGITVAELLGGYIIQMGDIIKGDLEIHGGIELLNMSQNEKIDAFIQGIHCTREFAAKLLSDD